MEEQPPASDRCRRVFPGFRKRLDGLAVPMEDEVTARNALLVAAAQADASRASRGNEDSNSPSGLRRRNSGLPGGAAIPPGEADPHGLPAGGPAAACKRYHSTQIDHQADWPLNARRERGSHSSSTVR